MPPRPGTPQARTRPAAAFTLIELLVVIAIIAILAAILFPVFAQAREKGRQAACVSNLKQITTGLRMYMDDYDGAVPAFGKPSDPMCMGRSMFRAADDPQSAPQLLNPYIKSYAVWICPSNVWREDDPAGKRNTYLTNWATLDPNEPFDAENRSPSTQLVIEDNVAYTAYTAVGATSNPPNSARIPNNHPKRFPHQGPGNSPRVANWGYLDGHVKVKIQ